MNIDETAVVNYTQQTEIKSFLGDYVHCGFCKEK